MRETPRNFPKTPGPWQWDIGGIHEENMGNSHNIPACTARWSSSQLGREDHPDMEGQLHWCHDLNGVSFPHPPLVSSNTPSRTATLAPQKITRPLQGLSIRQGIRAARLQRGAIFAHSNGNVGAWQAEEEGHLCRALQQSLTPWYIFWTLPRMDNVDEGY